MDLQRVEWSQGTALIPDQDSSLIVPIRKRLSDSASEEPAQAEDEAEELQELLNQQEEDQSPNQ